MAHMAGFDLPKSLPKATEYSPGGASVSQAAGKDGMILGSIGNFFKGAAKGIGNFAKSVFSGGSNSSSSGGGGFFGGGSSAPKTSGLDFGSAFKSTSDTGFLGYGQDLSYAQDNFGSFFNTDAFTPKTFSSGFNLFSGKSNYVPGVSETSGMGPLVPTALSMPQWLLVISYLDLIIIKMVRLRADLVVSSKVSLSKVEQLDL